MKTIFKTIMIALFLTNGIVAKSTMILDSNHVINPACNKSIEGFEGWIKDYDHNYTPNDLYVEQIENAVFEWIYSTQDVSYLKSFDTDKIYWQIVDPGNYSWCKYIGINLVIPETEISDDFYSQLAAGLKIPGTRLVDYLIPWINNGEIISLVMEKQSHKIVACNNWRFKCDPLNEKEDAYFASLQLNFGSGNDKVKSTFDHYVGNERVDSYKSKNVESVDLPINKISTLVFYKDDKVVGVVCYDLRNITTKCPMNYAVELTFNGVTNPSRILYTQPKCTDIYGWSYLSDEKNEEQKELFDWITSTFFSGL